MDNIDYFKDMFESIPDYRKKKLLIIFLIKNDEDLLNECGYLKNGNNRLNLEFRIILMEQNEEHLDCIKNEEESLFENILKK